MRQRRRKKPHTNYGFIFLSKVEGNPNVENVATSLSVINSAKTSKKIVSAPKRGTERLCSLKPAYILS
jgi:hypothetical protein